MDDVRLLCDVIEQFFILGGRGGEEIRISNVMMQREAVRTDLITTLLYTSHQLKPRPCGIIWFVVITIPYFTMFCNRSCLEVA